MNEKPLISAIVASYNYGRYLPERLESLLSQTYNAVEIIVIDDASSDNSLEVLASYENDPRIRIYKNKNNLGWVETSNLGAKLARGEFIIFANCDDLCSSTMIEELAVPLLDNTSVALSFCCSNLIDEQGVIVGSDRRFRERSFLRRCAHDTLLSPQEMIHFLCKSCVIPNLSAALIRKSAFFNLGGFSGRFKVCSDWDLYLKIARVSPVYYVRTPLSFFRQHTHTIRNSTHERTVYGEYITIVLELLQTCFNRKTRLRGRQRVAYYIASYLLRPGRDGVIFFLQRLSYLRKVDPLSLLFIPSGILARIFYVALLFFNKVFRSLI